MDITRMTGVSRTEDIRQEDFPKSGRLPGGAD